MNKLIHYELEARRRLKQSQNLLMRMARALMSTYAVSSGEQSLASYLRVDPTLSNEAAVALWIENNLQVLDVEVAEAVFGVLCSRFERCLSYVPQHMHGGAL